MTSQREVGESSHLLADSPTSDYTTPSRGRHTPQVTETGPLPTANPTNSLVAGPSHHHPVTMTTHPSSSSFFPGLKSWLQDISLPVYFFIMFFAISSWIDINGLWVEIPLLVNELPESWNLPSYIIVIIQLANVGPLAYTILVKLYPEQVKEWPFVYVIIAVGALSCLALVFFWDFTSTVGGELHSTGLLTLTFFLSLVDCTSSVVYLPYMAIFKPQYMTGFYIGEGLSGLIPGLVGLAQGVGGDPECVNTSSHTPDNDTEWNLYPEYPLPNFSVEVFFFFLFCMILVSGFSFTCIHFMPFAKREWVDPVGLYEITSEGYHGDNKRDSSSPETNHGVPGNGKDAPEGVVYQQDGVGSSSSSTGGMDLTEDAVCKTEHEVHDGIMIHSRQPLSLEEENGGGGSYRDGELMRYTRGQFLYLLVLTAWINGMTNGVLPSTQSYSCLPYGNLAYTLTVRLSTVANPLACFLSLFVPLPSLFVVGLLTFLGSVLSGYQLALAALSPEPPLQGEAVGEFLVITTAVLLTALFSYTKVSIASLLRRDGGRSALIWCGGVTQIGSFIGAILTFVLVNVLEVFETMPACPVV